MLRRVADNLFWAARYLERAEWRARLVDVNYHLLIESPPRGSEPWAPLLAITGDRDDFDVRYSNRDEASVLAFLTFDARNPSSIKSCVYSARENARALRNRISSELWLEINTLYLDAQNWSAELLNVSGVYGFFADLRDRFYRIAGIVRNTLPRDIGYDFLTIGTMLERTDNVTRLLDSKYHFLLPRLEDEGGTVDLLQWAAMLRSASALEAYRHIYGNTIMVSQIVELLLFDATFPRSACFCADRMEEALRRVVKAESGEQPQLSLSQSQSQQGQAQSQSSSSKQGTEIIENLVKNLRSSAADCIIRRGLHDYLMELQDECAAIGADLFDRYMRFE
jgi:uncharacterized alpha-E superfamily protein